MRWFDWSTRRRVASRNCTRRATSRRRRPFVSVSFVLLVGGSPVAERAVGGRWLAGRRLLDGAVRLPSTSTPSPRLTTNPRERKSRDAQNDTVHTQVALSASQLEPFVVLDVERVESAKVVQPPEKKASSKKRRRQEAPTGPRVMKGFLADVTLARERDLGVNDDQLTVRTHLGALLRCGDRVLGYDVRAANLASSVDGLGGNEPDVVLVRKCRKQDPDGPTPKRHWKLDTMEADEVHDEADHTDDREIFLSQLETDREMRSRVNLYKDGDHVEDDNEEGVRLEELLDQVQIEDEVEECAEDSVLEGVVVRGSGKS